MKDTAAAKSDHKFVTLDALRGIAALAVVVYHSTSLSAHLYQHAYLAVDFFFVLSGFVLSYAYGDRLARGWSFARFMKARLIRLWPLNALGLCAGFLLARVGLDPLAASARPAAFVLNFFFVPAGLHATGPALFPYNPAAWSLFFELVSNVLHALFLRRIKTPALLSITALTGATYVVRILQTRHADIGAALLSVDGYVRVLFTYCLGMLLYRVWRSGRVRMATSPGWMVLALAAVLAVSLPKPYVAAYDCVAVFLLLPGIVLLSAYGRQDAPYARVLQTLGTASYAIYVLQAPFLILADKGFAAMTHHGLAAARPFSAMVLLPLIVAVALLADRFFDVPARMGLRTLFSLQLRGGTAERSS